MRFVTSLLDAGKKFSTIQTYVSAIAFAHKVRNVPDPTTTYLHQRFMVGVKRSATEGQSLQPISKQMLSELLRLVKTLQCTEYEKSLLQAIMAVMYHGCLRVSEVARSGYADHALLASQVRLMFNFPRPQPSAVLFKLLSFKHSNHPQKILIKALEKQPSTCPVKLLWHYHSLKPTGSHYFFCDAEGNGINRDFLHKYLRQLVAMSSFSNKRINTHSFRIGRTTDLVMCGGVSDAYIRQVGRWSSNAYLKYIRPLLVL